MKKKIPLVLIVIAILLIGLGIYLGYQFANDHVTDYTNTKVYILEGKNKKFAVFNDKGKQLTDFEYKNDAFVATSAIYISNDNGRVLLSKSGKVVLDDKDFKEYTLVGPIIYKKSGSKKIVKNFEGQLLKEIDVDKYKIAAYSKNYIMMDEGDKQRVYDSSGTLIYSINAKHAKESILAAQGDYLIVSLDKDNYIIDTKANKLVDKLSFEKALCYAQKVGDLMIYSGCREQVQTNYIYYKSKRLYAFKGEDCHIKVVDDRLYCLSIKAGKTAVEVTSKGLNYAEEVENSTAIYYESKLMDRIMNSKLVKANEFSKVYSLVIGTAPNQKFAFYDLKAKKIIDNKFVINKGFDLTGKAIVADAYLKEYLIDTRGKKVSSEYNFINQIEEIDNVYYTANKDKTVHILNSKGKEVYKHDGSNLNTIRIGGISIFTFSTDKDKKVDVINPDKGVIIKNQEVIIKDDYIFYQEGKNDIYYTLSGKKIATIEKR